MGLAVTYLLVGVSEIIHMRHTVRIYWVHIVWTVNVLVYVLAVWWGMFWWNRLQTWSIEEFLFITIYSIVIFMLAAMLYPREVPEGLDFEAYFFTNKRWFFGIYLTATLLDVVETVSKGVIGLRPVPTEYVIYIPVVLAICATALITKRRRLHEVLCVAWLVCSLSYLAFTSSRESLADQVLVEPASARGAQGARSDPRSCSFESGFGMFAEALGQNEIMPRVS